MHNASFPRMLLIGAAIFALCAIGALVAIVLQHESPNTTGPTTQVVVPLKDKEGIVNSLSQGNADASSSVQTDDDKRAVLNSMQAQSSSGNASASSTSSVNPPAQTTDDAAKLRVLQSMQAK